jgi:hypothetical protein
MAIPKQFDALQDTLESIPCYSFTACQYWYHYRLYKHQKSTIKSLHIEHYILYLSCRVKVVDHWLYLMTILLGPTPVSRTAKTFGTPQCIDRVRPTLTWCPSRFSAQSVLLWGVDICRMICQYSALIESFFF